MCIFLKNTFLTCFVSMLMFGCNVKHETIKTKTKEPDKCEVASDAIHKFNKLNEDIFFASMINSIEGNTKKKISESLKSNLKIWICDTVFSEKSSDKTIVEWDINDKDFCKTLTSKIQYANGKKDSTEIMICNSKENKKVSAGGVWQYKDDDYLINLFFCNKIIDSLSRVGHYELRNRKGVPTLDDYPFYKYSAITDIYLDFKLSENGVFSRSEISFYDKIATASGFLYTAANPGVMK